MEFIIHYLDYNIVCIHSCCFFLKRVVGQILSYRVGPTLKQGSGKIVTSIV